MPRKRRTKEERLAYQRKWRKEHAAQHLALTNRWREENRDYVNVCQTAVVRSKNKKYAEKRSRLRSLRLVLYPNIYVKGTQHSSPVAVYDEDLPCK